ncbi:hypothetical protein [Holospora undulata]|nr:hypothetical protein [Holospora undulata]
MNIGFILLVLVIGEQERAYFLEIKENFTGKELLQDKSDNDQYVQDGIDTLKNDIFISKTKPRDFFIILEKMTEHAENSKKVVDFLEYFLPIHAIGLFEEFPYQMFDMVKKLSVKNFKFFEKIIKSLKRTSFIENNTILGEIAEFINQFKTNENFSESAYSICKVLISVKNVCLNTSVFAKIASWIDYMKKKDLLGVLECIVRSDAANSFFSLDKIIQKKLRLIY